MIPVTSFSGKTVALFGLGGSGRATALALKAGGATVIAFDDNPASIEAAAGDGIATGNLHDIDWSGVSALILSPGVPLTHPRPHWTADLAAQAGVPIIGDVELFSRERGAHAPEAPFVAITGTNGKSTTTALIAHCLRSAGRDTQLGGNIGVAVLTLDPPVPTRFYVVECSSYQIDLAPSIAPSVALLLNLTPDHLDRHGSMEHYAEVKARLLRGADTAVVGVDDAYCRAIADELQAAGRKVVRISQSQTLADGVFFDGASVVVAEAGAPVASLSLAGIGSLRGRHNGQNAAAAVAALLAAGLSAEEILVGLTSFPGLAHRMEEIGRIGSVLFVNDSKATNADAAAPALGSFRTIHWIAGGLPKEGGIASLAPLFPHVAKAYLIGEAAPAFAATLGESVPFEISGTLDIAVAHAARDAARSTGEGEPVVLLSPACASFDQFRNFEVRGAAFRDAVARLPGIELFRKGGA
ncbi:MULTISPECIES: UDP-N-acetylmuramoyl-L-alanine--D-glutamate ligase [unclassified Aureimonas]|uniref:UDP-N-acetylmuramoyl-L-alanine--D-glutamate ligase n=1 Tax=unclassified Aureimonas TaxID=2615206 RepID=UPI0006FF37B5|nr:MULTISPECIES: UDP-N-acetylmuramoyl-L-alanine--D-glutamate ligase [unclassified Aureimonas]KQT52833.1 UDP-N-acetylmuramoylalanine--D-glutamate ligase [Aureimonas sp. Leaf427]KQT80293.1 UDP-N-acetylmuramoylalanine--D-glutamate ligase [Aureimonas sp. Leaf460]